MYVDKPMHGHNLMQAIARVNRVFKDKPGGLVVDYIGIAAELKNALRTYTDAKGKGQPTVKAEDGAADSAGEDGCDARDDARLRLRRLRDEPVGVAGAGTRTLLEPAGWEEAVPRRDGVGHEGVFALRRRWTRRRSCGQEIAFFSAVRAVLVKNTATSIESARRRRRTPR